jgi:hypothetical protein
MGSTVRLVIRRNGWIHRLGRVTRLTPALLTSPIKVTRNIAQTAEESGGFHPNLCPSFLPSEATFPFPLLAFVSEYDLYFAIGMLVPSIPLDVRCIVAPLEAT